MANANQPTVDVGIAPEPIGFSQGIDCIEELAFALEVVRERNQVASVGRGFARLNSHGGMLPTTAAKRLAWRGVDQRSSIVRQAADPRFFFVHIMKTGGATFRQHVYANFQPGEVYPVPKTDDMDRAWTVPYLLGLPAERRDAIRAFTGHFPFVVSQLLGTRTVTITVLRDPVERTISYLKHCKRYHDRHRERPLEEIYEDPFVFPCFIHNHQAKIFAMTPDDKLESYMDVIDVDDRRLAIAKRHLEQVDALGLHEAYPEFLAELERRFDWRFAKLRNRRVSREDWAIAQSLRRRIAADNAADIDFFEHGRATYMRQQRARSAT